MDFEKQVESGRLTPTDATIDVPDGAAEDWTEVYGIGQMAADALHEAGFDTKIDVRRADGDELLDVGGIGQKNLGELKQFVR